MTIARTVETKAKGFVEFGFIAIARGIGQIQALTLAYRLAGERAIGRGVPYKMFHG